MSPPTHSTVAHPTKPPGTFSSLSFKKSKTKTVNESEKMKEDISCCGYKCKICKMYKNNTKEKDTLHVSANPMNLKPGTHKGIVKVSSIDAFNSPNQAIVTLNINGPTIKLKKKKSGI